MNQPPPVPPAPTPGPVPRACQNCGAPLYGAHCYACGQPVKGLVRHFSSILGDFFDSVLNFDARVPRTLWPLFARPGYLSCEYFEGHRVRYVSPVRLFVFLSIVTFFVAQLTLSFGGDAIQLGRQDGIARAMTVAEVEQLRAKALADIAQARRETGRAPGAGAGLAGAAEAVKAAADARIDVLREAQAKGEPPPKAGPTLTIDGGKPWDAEKNPIAISWLPRFANTWLNAQVGRAQKNIARMQEDPDLFKDAILGAIPSTLFVLLPVFALMLKVAYAFRRRLYMEHLIVALHSHAFLCLALLGLCLLTMLERGVASAPGALRSVFNLLEAGLWTWMPVYLLLMQKRVYGQGWAMTLLKYSVLGFCYVILLSIGAVMTVFASLVWM